MHMYAFSISICDTRLRVGTKAMKKSQIYPRGYGKAIRKHHCAWMAPGLNLLYSSHSTQAKRSNVLALGKELYPPGKCAVVDVEALTKDCRLK